jgi:chromosome segregation ATPase
MNRLKALNKQAKSKSLELTSGQSGLTELHSQARHLEEQLRAKDAKLVDLKSEFTARTGSADRGAVALRQELASLQDSLADYRKRRAEADTFKRQLEQSRDRALSQHNAEMAEIMAGMRQLNAAVSAYHARLFHAIAGVPKGSGFR